MKKFDQITEAQIKSRGVQALADRPNQTGQYGVAGLTAAQVKLHFDKLAMYLADKLNALFAALDEKSFPEYIKLAISEYEDLATLVKAMGNGDFAKRLLKVYPDAFHEEKKDKLQALQIVLNAFAKDISERVVQITDAALLRRAYIVDTDGSQKALPIAEDGKVASGAIPVYDDDCNLAGKNLVARVGAKIDAEQKTLKITLYAQDEKVLSEDEVSFKDLVLTYDANENGVVDDAEGLGGEAPDKYATAEALANAQIASIGLTDDNRLQIVLADGSVIKSADVISVGGGGEGGSGAPGADGLTPFIGENGNWWIGDEDTGVKAEGSGTSAVSSSLTELSWDADSTVNSSYHFKVFRYAADQDNLNVDFDVRLLVNGVGFRYPCNLQRPFGGASRIIFRTPRIIFEDEDNKTKVTYFCAYEKATEDAAVRELWLEIHVLDSADMVDEAHINVQVNGGKISDIELVQKAYDPYVSTSGYDSLTIYSADWANKTTNLNISSRAAAPYASASGNDSRADGEAGDVGGIENTGSGKADIVRGQRNYNSGDNSAIFGMGNKNVSSNSFLAGSNNNNSGAHSLLTGTKNTNTGSNAVMVGHTNSNSGDHAFVHGYENHNDGTGTSRCDYVDMHGTRLKAKRRLQMLRGQWNEEDDRALAIFGNGKSETDRRNVFAVPASGVPERYYDGITLGYFNDVLKALLVEDVIAALPIGEEASF